MTRLKRPEAALRVHCVPVQTAVPEPASGGGGGEEALGLGGEGGGHGTLLVDGGLEGGIEGDGGALGIDVDIAAWEALEDAGAGVLLVWIFQRTAAKAIVRERASNIQALGRGEAWGRGSGVEGTRGTWVLGSPGSGKRRGTSASGRLSARMALQPSSKASLTWRPEARA